MRFSTKFFPKMQPKNGTLSIEYVLIIGITTPYVVVLYQKSNVNL